MATKQQRRISIVIRVEKQKMYGHWQDAAEESPCEITINGETVFHWSEKVAVWSAIASNLQLDDQRDACRVLVYSDQPVEEEALPSWRSDWAWEIEEIARAIPQGTCAGKWYINGTDLNGRYVRLFPSTGGKISNNCYIYTLPVHKIPEGSGGSRTTLAAAIDELNRRQSKCIT